MQIRSIGVAAVLGACSWANAAGPLGIDHMITFDESGIWSRPNQLRVQGLSAATVIGGSLYLGTESRLGKTFNSALDSMLVADMSSAALKVITQRPRPRNINDPDLWRQGSSHKSFPSGEVTHITAVVTPFIYEYRDDYPVIWGLGILPAYVGLARMKSQAHWQTDVLAGMALGAASGYFFWKHNENWTAQIIGNTLQIGYRKNWP